MKLIKILPTAAVAACAVAAGVIFLNVNPAPKALPQEEVPQAEAPVLPEQPAAEPAPAVEPEEKAAAKDSTPEAPASPEQPAPGTAQMPEETPPGTAPVARGGTAPRIRPEAAPDKQPDAAEPEETAPPGDGPVIATEPEGEQEPAETPPAGGEEEQPGTPEPQEGEGSSEGGEGTRPGGDPPAQTVHWQSGDSSAATIAEPAIGTSGGSTGSVPAEDAGSSNKKVWYLLNSDGAMVTDGLVQDSNGNFFSLETENNGYFGMLRYRDGVYNCNGQQVYLEFSSSHDGSFGAVTNPEGLEKLKEIYGVTKYGIGNGNALYTAEF